MVLMPPCLKTQLRQRLPVFVTFHSGLGPYLGRMFKRVIFGATLSLVVCGSALAQPTTDDVVHGQFRPGWQTGTGTHMSALHLQLAPDWKTYWRAPGDAGIPPQFNWAGSENVASVRFFWPAPGVFHTNGLQTVGYHDELVLPFEVTAIDPSRPVRLRASVDLGVCKDVCVPATLMLDAPLAAPGGADATITAALNAQPMTARQAGLGSITCAVQPIADGLRITATMDLPAIGAQEVVVFEAGSADIWVSQAQVQRDGRVVQASADMVAPSGAPFSLDRSAVTVTVIGSQGRAVEVRGCPAG